MRKLLFWLAVSASATNIPISVQATSQQAVATYVSTIAGACTLALTDDSGLGVTVWDVAASKFANSNLDTSRADTKYPIGGVLYRSVVLGHRSYEVGSDGKIYSRSLQADAHHTLTVTCGSDSGTAQFATRTIALGTAYPELPQYCSGSKTWGYCQPSIDWTVSGKQIGYVDRVNGALVKRVSGFGEDANYPGMRPYPDLNTAGVPFAGAKDLSAGWTNINNALSYQGGTYATTTTNNAKLFLAFGNYGSFGVIGGMYGNGPGVVDDLVLQAFTSTSNGTDTVSACLTIDGQTCWAGTATITHTPSTTPAMVTWGDVSGVFPANPRTSPYQAWSMTYPIPAHLVAAAPMSATVNGTAVTLVGQTFSTGITFDDEWVAGAPIKIPTSNCTNTICTIASVTDTSHLVINESQANLGTVTVQPLNAGILVWKASGIGTLSINAAFGFAYSNGAGGLYGSNGVVDQCSRVPTTTNVDSNNVAVSPAHNGFLCWYNLESIFFWDSTAGNARWISNNSYNCLLYTSDAADE